MQSYFELMRSQAVEHGSDRTVIDDDASCPPDSEYDESYLHHCQDCNEMTLYSQKPTKIVTFNMCMAEKCVSDRINKLYEENNSNSSW